MADFTSNYNEELSEQIALRAGLQFKLFSRFFLRLGAYDDKGLEQKGNSIGISWVGPKILVDFSIVNSTFQHNSFQTGMDLKETSVSIALYF